MGNIAYKNGEKNQITSLVIATERNKLQLYRPRQRAYKITFNFIVLLTLT